MSKQASLHDVLKRWPGAPPTAGFEERVWQRIQVQPVPAERRGWSVISVAWVRMAALIAAMLTGYLVAVSLGPHPHPLSASVVLALDRTGTLTGDYLRQVRGE